MIGQPQGVTLVTLTQAQTPQPADWTTLTFTADLDKPADIAWERVGGNDWCGIAKFLDLKGCTINSGRGELGSVRTVVVGTTQTDVLNSRNVETTRAAQNPSKDVVVEVLVGQESNHSRPLDPWRASRRSRIPCGGERSSIAAWSARASSLRVATYASTSPRLSRTYEMTA